MSTIVTSIEIAVKPDRVWELIMDPRRLGEWVTIHRKLGAVDTPPVGTGFRFEQTLALHHANLDVKWTLTKSDPPRTAVWDGIGPAGSRARIVDTLTEVAGGTRFDYLNEYSQPGGLLGRVAGRVLIGAAATREAQRSLRRLKALLESPDGRSR